jgi:hypothetical protein
MKRRRRWLWRGAALLLVAVLLGVLTVGAMPARLPPELNFIWRLHPEEVDSPRHVGCMSAEQVYPAKTLRVAMRYPDFERLLKQELAGRKNWKLSVSKESGNLLAQRSPWISQTAGTFPSIELETVQTEDANVQQVVVTDFRKPYNLFSKWIIELRGK